MPDSVRGGKALEGPLKWSTVGRQAVVGTPPIPAVIAAAVLVIILRALATVATAARVEAACFVGGAAYSSRRCCSYDCIHFNQTVNVHFGGLLERVDLGEASLGDNGVLPFATCQITTIE